MDTAAAIPSLRTNFAWTLTGNVVHAASQWAMLSLIAKLGTPEMVGQYALAWAVCLPVAMLSHMNLRAVLATDSAHKHPFGDYLRVRLAATAAAFAATAFIVFLSGYRGTFPAVALLIGLVLSVENLSDLYYAAMQRRERMELIARSMIGRGVLSVVALGTALAMSRKLVWAVAALAAARLAIFLAYDRPCGSSGEDLDRSGRISQRAIVKAALPLGAVLMLVSLTANLPRYAIEAHLGTRQLGAYAAVASFVTVGTTIVNALGQSATPRLARAFGNRDLSGFHRLAWRLAGIAVAIGAAGVATAMAAGGFALRVLYRAEYAVHAGLLTAMMCAGALLYVSVTMGYVITSTRSFGPQMPLAGASAAASGIVSWALVPSMGLWGAAAAIAVAAAVQIAGQTVVLARVVRRAGLAS